MHPPPGTDRHPFETYVTFSLTLCLPLQTHSFTRAFDSGSTRRPGRGPRAPPHVRLLFQTCTHARRSPTPCATLARGHGPGHFIPRRTLDACHHRNTGDRGRAG